MSPLDRIPSDLWGRAARAPGRLLMLDYDGTLVPLRPDPREAEPPRRLSDLLALIAASAATRLAIVSGRPVRELETMLGPLDAVLVGEHGWEMKPRGGALVRHPLPRRAEEALERAAARAAAEAWDGRLERKRSALMLHSRGLDAAQADRLHRRAEAAWREQSEEEALGLHLVNGGLELRARGRHKGTAVRELAADLPPEGFAVYLGDDATDEDAFAAVSGFGPGVLVGAEDRPTRALGRLASPEEVGAFLEEWLARVEGRQAAQESPPRGTLR